MAALTEENLSEADAHELAEERKLRQAVQNCKDNAKAAKEEIKRLKAEKKGLDNKAPDYKQKSKEIDAKAKALQGVAKKKCKLVHKGCVPSDKSSRVTMPKEIGEAINNKYGTKVDFSQLSNWEGGAYSKAYIPWWPHMNSAGNPSIAARTDSSGQSKPTVLGDLSGHPKNSSGATVGVGVDLGQISNTSRYFEELDAANNTSNALTDAELNALKEKIKPYFNKKRSEACAFLYKNPLMLSEKEINLLNQNAHDKALKDAIRRYETVVGDKIKIEAPGYADAPMRFSDLSVEQQTALLSNTYQYGKPEVEMIDAIATGDRTKIPSTREHDYLSKSMPAAAIDP